MLDSTSIAVALGCGLMALTEAHFVPWSDDASAHHMHSSSPRASRGLACTHLTVAEGHEKALLAHCLHVFCRQLNN